MPVFTSMVKPSGALLVLLATFFLHACTAIDSPREGPEEPRHSEYFIDAKLAERIAGNILFPPEDQREQPRRRLTVDDFTVTLNVESVTPLEDADGKPLLYIVNYQGGGFVILSADKRVEPIWAYSSSNPFELRADIYHPGLVNWIDETAQLVQRARQSRIQPSRQMLRLWELISRHRLDVEYLGADLICGEDGYVVQVGPLIETRWGQGCGYNDALPNNSCPGDSGRCYRYPVGCVATAMAQIARYWEAGYTTATGAIAITDWDAMPDENISEGDSPDVAQLMANMGGLVDMNYGCSGSGASSGDAHDAFVDNFPFSNASMRDLDSGSDYQRLISEIENQRPVYMRGCNEKETTLFFFTSYSGCHAWIADGTSERFNCDDEAIPGTHTVNMNWGWGGNSDGLYKVKDKEDGDYIYDRKMIYNIYH